MSQYQPINDERAPFMGTDKTSAFDIGDEEEQAVSGTTLSYPPAPAYTGKAILTYTYRTEWDQPHNAMGVLGRSKDVGRPYLAVKLWADVVGNDRHSQRDFPPDLGLRS